jgi:hypothetical protein
MCWYVWIRQNSGKNDEPRKKQESSRKTSKSMIRTWREPPQMHADAIPINAKLDASAIAKTDIKDSAS